MNTEQASFDGDTFDHAKDHSRLKRQLDEVKRIMSDGAWRTLNAIALGAEAPATSVSARLRDLRKEKFGGHTVNRRRIGKGLFEYRLAA